jgi:hypothetical protein
MQVLRQYRLCIADHAYLTCLGCSSCPQDNSSVLPTQETQPLSCCTDVYNTLLHNNSHGAGDIENTVLLLLHECMLRPLLAESTLRNGSLSHTENIQLWSVAEF